MYPLINKMLGLDFEESKRLYTPHLLFKEIILPELSLTILSFVFLLKKQQAIKSYFDIEKNNRKEVLPMFLSLEDRYINGVVAYHIGLLSGNDSEYYTIAHRLLSNKILSFDEPFYMATMYRYGRGVSVNHLEALRYYEMGADHNNVKCLVNIGYCYRIGNIVEKDYNKAVTYFKKAVLLNDALSKSNLAFMYEMGMV